MKITEFCALHDACAEGLEWASGTGCTTMADLWKREDMLPEWREWIATRPGVLEDRELRLYACWCARQIWHLLTDERSRTAVEVAERHAMGAATAEELAAAMAAAAAAASPARAASLIRSAARAAWAAWAAWASCAARDAWAASPSAWAARSACATRASRAAQASYLLAHVRPNFESRKEGKS
jgi:hypothetical protein